MRTLLTNLVTNDPMGVALAAQLNGGKFDLVTDPAVIDPGSGNFIGADASVVFAESAVLTVAAAEQVPQGAERVSMAAFVSVVASGAGPAETIVGVVFKNAGGTKCLYVQFDRPLNYQANGRPALATVRLDMVVNANGQIIDSSAVALAQ